MPDDLAGTQAALRRLAVLIAEGASPTTIFAAVTEEVWRRYRPATVRMIRYEGADRAKVVANQGTVGPHVRVGQEWTGFPATGLTETVRRTGRPARVDDYRTVPGAERYASEGLVGAVGAPIYANGRLWGLIALGSTTGPLPSDAEDRLVEFTDLTALAIANAQSRADLVASRARIVAAADEARRRIERNLHDGAQQQLVSLGLRLSMLAQVPDLPEHARIDLQDISSGLRAVLEELREIAQGIHPAILSQAGLGPALGALSRRSTVPVALRVDVPNRLPPPIEAGAYYIVSEGLTNAAKHARAGRVDVDVFLDGEILRITVADDGIGGAASDRGSGLIGLHDRAQSLGGYVRVDSPAGRGTRIQCEIPIADAT